MRAWCATKDTDKNMHIIKDQLDRVNKEVKLFRDIVRVLLTHLQTYDLDLSRKNFDFNKNLTFVDKMMVVRTLEFSKDLSEAYDKFDLKKVYELTRDFAALDVADFYLDFTKYRRRRLVESHIQAVAKTTDDNQTDSDSSLFVMHQFLNTLMLSCAPILVFTAQEAFDHMPLNLFTGKLKPPTVFQMPNWHLQTLTDLVDAQFLSKFEIRDSYKNLLALRNFIRKTYEESALEYVQKRSYQQTQLHFIVSSIDSNEANLLEVL